MDDRELETLDSADVPPDLAMDLRHNRALLAVAMSESEDAEPGEGSELGGYRLLEELGSGGMGVVYRARHSGIQLYVALKLMRAMELATPDEQQRFRLEAERAASLEHPNIVPILHVDEHEAHPFFTMKLIEGENLARHLAKSSPSLERAAAWMIKVARAVEHAHARGVLHLDLKPANILLDPNNEPHVADFGISRWLGDRSGGCGGGTVAYMAPEQACGGELTVRTDVYALGVVLYELITRKRPFEGATDQELRDKLISESPPPPRSLNPRIDRELESICLRCLEKDSAARYASAGELGGELELWLSDELVPRTSRGLCKLWFTCRRYPLALTGVAAVCFVVIATLWLAVSAGIEQETALRNEALKANRYAARATAGQVLFQLRLLSERLVACSGERRLLERLRQRPDADGAGFAEASGMLSAAEQALRDCGAGSAFDAATLFNREGVAIARHPRPLFEFRGKSYAFRDYFQRARALGRQGRREAHFARAYRSEGDGETKVALSVPVIDDDGAWLGVIGGLIGTNAHLGSLRLFDPNDAGRLAVLVGLRDRERSEASEPLPSEHRMLVHERLERGQMVTLAASPKALAWLRTLDRQYRAEPGPQLRFGSLSETFAEAEHRDPIAGFEGRWLAGFAPVGRTAYAVVVQTRDSAVVGPHRYRFLRLLGISAALVMLGASAVFVMARYFAWRRGRRLRWLRVS
jgi:serine/threonine-protein kinase